MGTTETLNEVELNQEVKTSIKEAEIVVQTYKEYKITTPVEYKASAEDLKRVKGKIAQLTEIRISLTKPIDEAKKRIMDLFRKPIEQLQTLESAMKRAIVSFEAEEEARRRKEEERLQAEARAREQREKEKLEAKAAKLEAKGDAAGAEAMRTKKDEVFVPKPIVESRVEKVAGVHKIQVWKAEVTDLMTLVKAVAEGRAPLMFIEANTQALNKQAKATKDTLQVPGVRFYAEATVSARQESANE